MRKNDIAGHYYLWAAAIVLGGIVAVVQGAGTGPIFGVLIAMLFVVIFANRLPSRSPKRGKRGR